MLMSNLVGELRAGAITRQIRPFVQAGESMLDIGSGSGMVAASLVDKVGVDITMLETFDYNATRLPLTIYDGNTIPFEDKSFSTSSLIFVLHHANNSPQLLSEAARVSRHQVLVMEDSPATNLEKRVWEWADYKMNHAVHEEVAVAHETKTTDQWEVDFNAAGLYIQCIRKFRSVFTTALAYPHTLYALRPE